MSQRCFSPQVFMVCFLLTLAASGLFFLDQVSAQTDEPAQPRPDAYGEPDDFGYTFRDSKEPNGPTYAWEEISTTGTLVTGWTDYDNGYAGPIPIGFTFNYYGVDNTEFYVSTNGYISFGQGSGAIPGSILPDPAEPNNDIGLSGGDMWLYDYGDLSTVYYQTLTNPTRLVLEYKSLYHCCNQNYSRTFEVILYENGDIQSQYYRLDYISINYVGIENSAGTDGLIYGYDLFHRMAIRYYYPTGVLLAPPGQFKFGEPGTTTPYIMTLTNLSGTTDSFNLQVLPGNTWTTTLSTSQVGPIMDSEILTFTAWVEVPPTAQVGDSDAAAIQATSITSPSINITATLSTLIVSDEIAYVPMSDSNSLALIDTQTHNPIGNIDLALFGCDHPDRARLTPDGSEVYVVCEFSSQEIVVLETTNLSLVATIPISGACYMDIAFVLEGAYGLLSKGWCDSASDIDVINTTTHTIVQTISTSDYSIMSIVAHPYLPLAYAAGYNQYTGAGSVLVIDTNSFTIQTIIPFGGWDGGNLWEVQVSPDGQWLYAGGDWWYEDGGLIKIDVSTNSIVDTLSGYRIFDINITPDGSKIFALQAYDEPEILVIDAHTLDVITNIPEYYDSEGELTCDGSEFYLIGSSSSVQVIDTQSYSQTYEISVPGSGATQGFDVCPQYMSPDGVYLTTPSQEELARAGDTLTYTLELLNLTGTEDSFGLQVLSGNTWTTTLSTSQVGPLADGESITFTVTVEAPLSAQPGDGDLAILKASSLTQPMVYTATATLDSLVLSDELAYIAFMFGQQVAVVDVATQAVVESIYTISAGGHLPWRATLSPDGAFVYVGSLYSDSVLVIDTNTLSVAANIPDILSATDVVFTRSGAYALVGSRDSSQSQIAVIDTATFRIVQYIDSANVVDELAAHPYLDLVYAITNPGVVVIDTSTFTIIDTIVLSGYPADIAVSPDGAWLFACAPGEAVVWVIDTHSNSIYTTISGIEANSLDISRDGEFLYAGGWSDGGQNGSVWVIDAPTFTPITSLTIDGVGMDVALTSDETQLYVGMLYGNLVAVIDTATFSVTSTITMPGDEPVSIAIEPEYIGRNVFLDPTTQTGEGGRGQVVEYSVTLTNSTMTTDTFSLSLGVSAWESSLSTDQIGPLPDGGSASFSMYVTVPQDAPWYTSDTVTVTADSLASPGVYTATAQATTLAYAPPQIGVDPLNLESSQFVGQVTTQTLTISNGPGVTLTYEISTGLDAPWLSIEPVLGSVPSDSYNPVQVTFDATDLLPDLYTTTLLINHNDASQPPISVPVSITVVQPQAGVMITPTEAELSGSPGEMIVYTFTLTNTGDLADSFTLDVSSTWTTTLSVTSTGELQAGEMYIFMVYVTIPLDVDDGAHDLALITATSAYDPQVSAEVQATTSGVIQPVEVQLLYIPLAYKT